MPFVCELRTVRVSCRKMEWNYVLAGLGLGFLVLRYYLTCTYSYWKKQSIPCVGGVLPGIGNMLSFITMRKNFSALYEGFYNEMRGHSMAGFYNMRTPCLLLRDPELVKTVLVEEFHNFQYNDFSLDPVLDPLISAGSFFSNGEQWKISRSQISSSFTSSKQKVMFLEVKEICSKMLNYLNRKMELRGNKLELELKDLFSRYTAEVVANVAFGAEGESFKGDEDGPFREAGRAFLEPSLIKGLKQMLVLFFPFVGTFFSMRLIPLEVDQFFRQVIRDVVRSREQHNITGNDFLQLMMQLKTSGARDCISGMAFSNDSITAHATAFFADGYETSSITLSFVAYLLSVHTDVQERLRDEVNDVTSKYNGLTYEAIGKMTYMDQIINETLRLFPPFGAMLKVCTKETVLRGEDGLEFHITPGTKVVIPLQALQKDPRFWPNPEEFDPDRFNAENKRLRHKYVHLPFSDGPRICIGMRMALMVMKAALAAMVQKYSLELSPKTKLPLQMRPDYFLMQPKGGLWVYVKPL